MMKQGSAWLAVLALTACTTTTTVHERVVDHRSDYPAMWLEPANCGVHSTDPHARELLASLASLGNNSYLTMEQEQACRSGAAGSASKACAGYLPTERQWNIVGGNGEDSPTGLAYRIYESPAAADGKPLLAFAFRGTEFWSRDWVSNLYLRTRVPPPQQREADREIRAWIATHRPQWNLETGAGMEGEEVYAVGHSLGGAVAQYLAYTMPRVTAVVFNPSPRTGYASIAPGKYRNPAVCRMRESYEAVYTLAGGRVPLVSPNLHACGFINQKRISPPLLASLVSAHSMRGMADALGCYAEEGTPSPECRAIVEHKDKAMPGVACH